MKKRAVLFLVVVLFINVISASYNCSVGEAITDGKIIYVEKIKSVNKINIALLFSDWGAVAEILLDAKQITLTNSSPSQDIELISGDYEINLINISEDDAWISIEGKKKQIKKGELEKVDDLQVYLLDLSVENSKLEFFVGSKYFFLYDKNPSSIETLLGTNYLIKVLSSSPDEAMINVIKCENGTITEIIEEVVVDDNSSLPNETLQNQSGNTPTDNINTTPAENITNSDSNAEEGNILSFLIKNNIYITIIFVLIIIAFYFLSKKSNKEENELDKEEE